MRIHYLQHHEAFRIGHIKQWAEENNHEISGTDLSKKERLPKLENFDMLVTLGGSMGAYEEGKHLWIKQERDLIGESIIAGKLILGFGLGAQIISQSLRGEINKCPYRELGFGEVRLNKQGREFALLKNIPEKITVLNWHKDIFEIPRDCHLLAKSKGCKHQAFRFHNRVLGLQFHLETTSEDISRLIKLCRGEIVKGQFMQSTDDLEKSSKKCKNMNILLDRILENYAEMFNNI